MAVDRLPPVPRRLLGLGMIGLVVALLALCVAFYNKVFTPSVPVTMHIDQVDNSFLPQAEVRLRGVTVGTVTSVVTEGREAVVSMALEPAQVRYIPRNVTAQLLPKTLFGERYVALEVPPSPSPERIRSGDVISRDRSGSAVEVEQLFNNLLPLLQAVRPADLANTLGALNQALTGRGEQLGQTLVQLHDYLSKFNVALPELTEDIKALPQVTDTYSAAAPDLIQALSNLTTTSNTLVERQDDFSTLYSTVTDASDDLYDFLKDNKQNLINLVHVARPTLELLARYSPEYVCFFNQVADAVGPIDQVLGKGTNRPAVNITLEVAAARGPYEPHKDEPDFTDDRGPRCYPKTVPQVQYPGGPFQDGSSHQPASGQASRLGALAGALPSLPNPAQPPPLPLLGGSSDGGAPSGPLGAPVSAPAPSGPGVSRPVAPVAYTTNSNGTPSIANTRPEQQLVSGLVADMTGSDPATVPAWSSLLVGPLLRGAEVTLR
jgi:phospholipid/cholesterol/gamma-HCH transport system substrate-binding protein